jgi:hypothetical protein
VLKYFIITAWNLPETESREVAKSNTDYQMVAVLPDINKNRPEKKRGGKVPVG